MEIWSDKDIWNDGLIDFIYERVNKIDYTISDADVRKFLDDYLGIDEEYKQEIKETGTIKKSELEWIVKAINEEL